MHILQLVPRMEVGGVERGVVDLARGLIAGGDRVTVVSAGGRLVPALEQAGARHVALPIDRKSLAAIRRCVPAICRLIREQGVDVIHARSRVPGWIGYLASVRTGRPLITTCHGFYRPHVFSRVMGWGRTVIVPSEAVGRHAVDQLGVPPERLRVIPRGVDLREFPLRTDAPRAAGAPWRLGLVGRLTGLKGHAVAIQALHQLRRRGIPVVLSVIGDAPADKAAMRDTLVDLARRLDVADAMEWLGTRDDVAAALSACDAAVAPSIYPESFGRSIIEAQAVGVPVVASRLGAFSELIDHERTGLLVPAGDSTALADAVQRLIEDDGLRHRLGAAGRRRVEAEYTVERMIQATRQVYADTADRLRILVWKLSALGDAVLVTPSVRAIRRHFPGASITLAVGRGVYDLMASCPYVDRLMVFDSMRKDRTWLSRLAFIRLLRRQAFDCSIDLQNSRWTHLAAWAAGIPRRLGYARRWGRLLSQPVPLPKDTLHPVAHQQHLLRAAGIAPDGDRLELWPSALDAQAADKLLADLQPSQPVIGLHPGASARWRTKQWDTQRWASICDRLDADGCQVVITGGAGDAPVIEAIVRQARSKPLVLAGHTRLSELACVIRRFAVYVTTDSAPLHLAAAVGTPAVALFGPTDPARHVVPSRRTTVLFKRVFCSPCYSPRCRTVTHACMKRISPDDVLDAIEVLRHAAAEAPAPQAVSP